MIGNHPNRKNGTKNQSFMYDIEEENPYLKPIAEYFTKLWLLIPVATIDIAINHHVNRLPPKKSNQLSRKIVSASSSAFRIFPPIRDFTDVKNFPVTRISIASAKERIGSSIRSPTWILLSASSRLVIARKSIVKHWP